MNCKLVILVLLIVPVALVAQTRRDGARERTPVAISRNAVGFSSNRTLPYAVPAATGSGGVEWGSVVKLSPDDPYPSGGSYTPRLAVQGDTIHCVWYGYTPFRLPYMRSTDGGLSWEEPRNLIQDTTTSPCITGWHQIVADSSNVYIFFVFGYCRPGAEAIPAYFVKSSDHGSTWSHPVAATTDTTGAIFSASTRGDTMAGVYVPDWGGRAQYPRITGSTNGGVTWSRSAQEMPSSSSNQLRVALTPGLLNFFPSGRQMARTCTGDCPASLDRPCRYMAGLYRSFTH